jgi:DUF1680 family protein
MTHPSPIVVDTFASAHARLKPAPLTAVTLADAFWAPRCSLLRAATLPSQYRLLEETGRRENFRRVAGKSDKPFQGLFFNDSDVYKWIEAAAWSLATDPDPVLAAMTDAVIGEIEAAQQPDGYLNTYYSLERAGERWSNLKDMHELYCAGHLFQAAVAHYRATGSDRLLAIARRLADNIGAVFGPQPKRAGACGHPEIEMGLVELARATGVREYLALAQYFLDVRGRGVIGGSPYHQDHKPFRELDRMVGHAVRAVYLNAGATDLYAESDEEALWVALTRLWENMTTRQMYISGGVGSRYQGEAFGDDFELPNARAYTETCAAIAVVMWAWRMLALDGDARYADALELALYNGVLAGLSLDGQHYFYVNPLANDRNATLRDDTRGRQPWFNCACCPPNIARLLASLPGYFYNVSADTVWCHLYAAGAARLTLEDGRTVRVRQETDYPWDGDVTLILDGAGEFGLRLRIPGWCDAGASLAVNDQPVETPLAPGSYAEVRRAWQAGDVVRLRLPMPMRRLEGHPYTLENTGRVAPMRGPLLYCIEEADHPGEDLRDVTLPAAGLKMRERPDLLGGVVTLTAKGRVRYPEPGWTSQLYRTAGSIGRRPRGRHVTITAIPYYAWANRGVGQMQVWLKGG